MAPHVRVLEAGVVELGAEGDVPQALVERDHLALGAEIDRTQPAGGGSLLDGADQGRAESAPPGRRQHREPSEMPEPAEVDAQPLEAGASMTRRPAPTGTPSSSPRTWSALGSRSSRSSSDRDALLVDEHDVPDPVRRLEISRRHGQANRLLCHAPHHGPSPPNG